MWKAICLVMGVLFSLPIWFYLLYQILVRVEASELMWFLYWVYIPVTVVTTVLSRFIAEND